MRESSALLSIQLLILLVLVGLSHRLLWAADTGHFSKLNTSIDWVGSDGRLLSSPSANVQLGVQAVIVRRPKTANDLLRSAGVLPTFDAYAVIYKLNPSLEKLENLANGVELSIPAVVGDSAAMAQIKEGSLVRITLDRSLKDNLCGASQSLDVDWRRIGDLGQDNAVTANAAKIRDALTAFQIACRSNQLLSSGNTLNQVIADRNTAQNLLSKALSMRPLNDIELQDLAAIATDLTSKEKRLRESRGTAPIPSRPNDEVAVRINVVDGGGNPLPNLRVYWEPRISFNPQRDLGTSSTLTPNVDVMLAESQYYFWAAPPNAYPDGDIKRPPGADQLEVTWKKDQPVPITVTARR